jgi:hypothetical protein
MTSFAIVDIIYKPEKKKVFIDLGSMGIVFVYLLTVICPYLRDKWCPFFIKIPLPPFKKGGFRKLDS